ncbi:MAG: VOC family protein [Hyphomicrobiales bacterium]|nr:VOC family protein [Hyphomicrobiales bacterium]
MRETGKLDYLEMPATGGTIDSVKAFYSAAFGWTFTDYGPSYAAFGEGLDGGFHSDPAEGASKPLPILYSGDLEATLVEVEAAGGRIVRPIFSFPGGRRFHFLDPAGNELAVWSDGPA